MEEAAKLYITVGAIVFFFVSIFVVCKMSGVKFQGVPQNGGGFSGGAACGGGGC
jgi:hypothetical protein